MAVDNFARILAMKANSDLVDVNQLVVQLEELIGDIESYDLDTLFGRINQNTADIEIINGDATIENSTYWKIAQTDFIVSITPDPTTGRWEFANNDGTIAYMDYVQVYALPPASPDNLGRICQYVGITSGDLINGYFYKCVEQELWGSISYYWRVQEVQNSTHVSNNDLNALIEVADGLYVRTSQISIMPTPNSKYVGIIIQYVGATNANYTQGDYYICKYNYSTQNTEWVKLTYNKEEVDSIVSAAGHFLVVTTLPTTNIKTNIIYLVPKIVTLAGYSDGTTNADMYVDTGTVSVPVYDKYIYNSNIGCYKFNSTITGTDATTISGYISGGIYTESSFDAESRESNNIKTEYINLDGTVNGWEKIGDTEIDLSGYVQYENLTEVTLAEINQMWANAEGV